MSASTRFRIAVLVTAFSLTACAHGGIAGSQFTPLATDRHAGQVNTDSSVKATLQDLVNAANGFPPLSLHAQLAMRAPSTFAAGNGAASAGNGLLYSGNNTTSTINYFSSQGSNPPLLGQITNGLSNPERLFVDRNLKVYATNQSTNSITVYASKGSSPVLTITDGISDPTGLIVDSKGTVYCANVATDTITEYPAGKTSPSVTINMGSNSPENFAVDSKDNLYVSYLGFPGNVIEFKHGSTTGIPLNLKIGTAGALEVDKAGNLIVIDSSGPSIDIFPAGKTTPSKKIAVASYLDPFELSMNASETAIFASVLNINFGTWEIDRLAYPSGTALVRKDTTNVGDWPLAVSPDNVL